MISNRLLTLIALTLAMNHTRAQESIDIWNLPPLSIEQGRYTTDWNNLSRLYRECRQIVRRNITI